MRVRRNLGLLGGMALLFCLPAILRPSCSHPVVAAHEILPAGDGPVYKVHVDKCEQAPAKGSAAVFKPVNRKELGAVRPEHIWSDGTRTSLGEWEMAVVFDAVHCDLYCAYRRKTSSSGRVMPALLLPPPVSVQIPMGAASRPISVLIDPSGLTLPSVYSHARVTQEPLYLPAKTLLPIDLGPRSNIAASSPSAIVGSSAPDFPAAAPTLLPLRI